MVWEKLTNLPNSSVVCDYQFDTHPFLIQDGYSVFILIILSSVFNLLWWISASEVMVGLGCCGGGESSFLWWWSVSVAMVIVSLHCCGDGQPQLLWWWSVSVAVVMVSLSCCGDAQSFRALVMVSLSCCGHSHHHLLRSWSVSVTVVVVHVSYCGDDQSQLWLQSVSVAVVMVSLSQHGSWWRPPYQESGLGSRRSAHPFADLPFWLNDLFWNHRNSWGDNENIDWFLLRKWWVRRCIQTCVMLPNMDNTIPWFRRCFTTDS